jgi:hypothetical protein
MRVNSARWHRRQQPVAAHRHRHRGAADDPRRGPGAVPQARDPGRRRLVDPDQRIEVAHGQFFIDDEVLHKHGVHDLDRYAMTPGNQNFIPDFFVD